MNQTSRPAATTHSHNRKPRDTRKRWRKKAQGMAASRKQERVINAMTVGRTLEEAAVEAGIINGERGLKSMAAGNPGFQARLKEAEREGALARARAAGVLDRQLEDIAEAHVNIALGSKVEAIRAKTQYGILKGRGVLIEDKVQVAVRVEINEPPKYVEVHEIERSD